MSESGVWTYTLCDISTGKELATLPLTGVKYSRQVKGVGKLDGYLGLTDPKVRALNPWGATVPRRTALYAELDDVAMWGGPVVARPGGAGSQGMRLSCISWEGWLHRQLLLEDVELHGDRLAVIGAILAQLRTISTGPTQNGEWLTVRLEGGAGAPAEDYLYLARDVKPVLEILNEIGEEFDLPHLEYRVDVGRDQWGNLHPTLVIGETRLGRRYEETSRTFAYPDGALVDWEYPGDGTAGANIMPVLGSGSGISTPFLVVFDGDAGGSELESGFPAWMSDLRASDTDDEAVMLERAIREMRSGWAAEQTFTGVQVRPGDYLGKVNPGDDVALEIVHPLFQTWPEPITHITRVLGESVTIGDGGKADKVSLTVGGTVA